MNPSFDPREDALRKARLMLRLVVGGICVGAGLILIFAKQLPLPARVLMAAMDIIIAAVLWLVMRQKLAGK